MSDFPELPNGWDYYDYGTLLGRADGVRLKAPGDMSLCSQVITDFEFREGARWTPEQIAAMLVKPGTGVAVPSLAQNEIQPIITGIDIASGLDRTSYRPWPPLVTEARLATFHQSPPNNVDLREAPTDGGPFLFTAPSNPASWSGESEPIDPARYTIDHDRAAELQMNDPSLTPERLRAGVAAMLDYDGDDAGEIAAIWKAMGADAGREIFLLRDINERQAKGLGDAANEIAYLRAYLANMPTAASVKEMLDGRDAEITLLRQTIAALTSADEGSHDYHGPVQDGRAIPDTAHEQFNRAVGDVLAGKIIPAARRQMQEALARAPKDAPTTASTSRPMPGKALGGIGQSIGLRLP